MNLCEASLTGNIKRVNELLAQGYDPTVGENFPIRMASRWNRVDVVKALLQDGYADPTACNNAAFRYACKHGHTDIVRLLLQDDRVDPTDKYNYAIHKAILMGYTNIVSLLLEDGRVKPPLDGFMKYTTPEIKEMLIRYKYRVDGKEYCRLKNEIKS
jgi:ankyrin repeat protein